METLSAAVREVDQKHFLVIGSGGEEVRIPLSEDKPAQVKKAFNELILRVKRGPFTIKVVQEGEDLISHVAKEYVIQLNREIKEVRALMEQRGLIDE